MDNVENLYNKFMRMDRESKNHFLNEILKIEKNNSKCYGYFNRLTKSEKKEFIEMIYENIDAKLILSKLEKYFLTLNTKKNIDEIISRIEDACRNLSYKDKKKVYEELESCLSNIDYIYEKQIIENCNHTYGDWIMYTYTVDATVYDAGPQGKVEVTKKRWYRKCTKCGSCEYADIEPIEAKRQREEKEKQKKIKFYKSEIDRLEGRN